MKIKFKDLKIAIICVQLLLPSQYVFSQNTKNTETQKNQLNINELTLPSEVSNLAKQRGAMYYSPTIKDKILIPIHFWGEVKNSGLHYVPIGTTLVSGLSLAGGPGSNAVLSDIKLTRTFAEQLETKAFNLEEGGNKEAYFEKLQAGDTVFIKKSNFYENRAYYTSLVGIFSTVLGSILLYRKVQEK